MSRPAVVVGVARDPSRWGRRDDGRDEEAVGGAARSRTAGAAAPGPAAAADYARSAGYAR
ncbi:hypothetical protein [Pseudonocardia sp. NPDC049635]|uniref:hypothetical protein n=1 Tax=Pseudonocardia sp. NPDC049635 TaxID=3155506 RepID=UPI0033C7DFAA